MVPTITVLATAPSRESERWSTCRQAAEPPIIGPRGINGPIEQLLFPLTHGALFYAGMDVLPTHAVHSTMSVSTPEQVEAIKAAWRERLAGLFTDMPISFRMQNGGDYPDRRTLADHVAPGQTGLVTHFADPSDA